MKSWCDILREAKSYFFLSEKRGDYLASFNLVKKLKKYVKRSWLQIVNISQVSTANE